MHFERLLAEVPSWYGNDGALSIQGEAGRDVVEL
jgi:hypothetical protein